MEVPDVSGWTRFLVKETRLICMSVSTVVGANITVNTMKTYLWPVLLVTVKPLAKVSRFCVLIESSVI